jgi:broad specificity phosphatase PhoE
MISMSIKITYFVHSTTTDNEQKLATGWSPGELSELGIKQAHELKNIVSEKDFDTVFSSDLRRAIQTSEIAFSKFSRKTDSMLREINFGQLEHTIKTQFESQLDQYIEHPFPGGESFMDVEQRMRLFLDDLKTEHSAQHIAIVAHQAPQLALDVLINGKSWAQALAEDWRKTKSWQPGWDYDLP